MVRKIYWLEVLPGHYYIARDRMEGKAEHFIAGFRGEEFAGRAYDRDGRDTLAHVYYIRGSVFRSRYDAGKMRLASREMWEIAHAAQEGK